jgi:hypothetical protein
MKTCKNCEYFEPHPLAHKDPRYVRGFCMDLENPTFNAWAHQRGRGLPWKAYFFGTEGCKFKKK